MLWVDVETTNLDPLTADLLEVGLAHTDRFLNVLGKINVVISQDEDVLLRSWEAHTRNGLLHECRASAYSMQTAEHMLQEWFDARFGGEAPVLFSDYVDFDKGLLKRHMPALSASFGHRVVDVGHVRRLSRLWHMRTAPAVEIPKVHRALHCIRRSIEEMRFYRDVLFKLPAVTAVA